MSGTRYGFIQKREQAARRERLSEAMFAFGESLEHGPRGMFHDENTLKYSKLDTLGGFLNAIANANMISEIAIYEICAHQLASYLHNVGDEPFTPYEDALENYKAMNAKQYSNYIKSIDVEKFERLRSEQEDDKKFISDCIEAARSMNQNIIPPVKKLWNRFRQRGAYSPFYDGFDDASEAILRV